MEFILLNVERLSIREEEDKVSVAFSSLVLEGTHQFLACIADMLILMGSTKLIWLQEVKQALR